MYLYIKFYIKIIIKSYKSNCIVRFCCTVSAFHHCKPHNFCLHYQITEKWEKVSFFFQSILTYPGLKYIFGCVCYCRKRRSCWIKIQDDSWLVTFISQSLFTIGATN